MPFPFKFRPLSSPAFVMDCEGAFNTVTSPFRASVVGIVHHLEDVGATHSGDLRRTFKLAGDNVFWIYCFACGKHGENIVLENMRHICICFGTGRSQVGSLPQGLRVFIDSFCVPLGRESESSLLQGVKWRETLTPLDSLLQVGSLFRLLSMLFVQMAVGPDPLILLCWGLVCGNGTGRGASEPCVRIRYSNLVLNDVGLSWAPMGSGCVQVLIYISLLSNCGHFSPRILSLFN